MKKYQIKSRWLRIKYRLRFLSESLQQTRVQFVTYIVVVMALIAAILIFPTVVPIDDKLERVSAVIGIIVKILTALSLLAALIWAPPYFKDILAKDYLKDLVKATQEADVKVLKKAVSLLDYLGNPKLKNDIIPKSDVTFFKDEFAELKLVALEAKGEVATLITLTANMLRHLEHEYEKMSEINKLEISTFVGCLYDILDYVRFLSSSVVKLPRSQRIEQMPIAKIPLKKYVANDKYELFNQSPRGVNASGDAPIPLFFFETINRKGDFHFMRAAALIRSPEPFFIRLLNIHKIYVPLRVTSKEFKLMNDDRLLTIHLIGFKFRLPNSKDTPAVVKAWYSNLNLSFVYMKNKGEERLKGPFIDAIVNKGFFGEVTTQKVRYLGKETIEMTFSLKEVERYHQRNRRLIEYAIHRIDDLDKAGKDIGNDFISREI